MNFIEKKEFEDLRSAIKNSVNSFIAKPGNNEKKSLYKSIISDMINECFKEEIREYSDINSSTINLVKNKFSGRGKSWVKICEKKDSILWKKLQDDLRNNSLFEKECNDYMDKFELLGFGYVRYYSSNLYNCKFEVRIHGSLKSSKLKLSTSHREALELDFLEGTPLSTSLECRNEKVFDVKKIDASNDVIIDSCFKTIEEII